MRDARDVVPPLSIGEIVDRAITMAVRRWRTLLVLSSIEALPVGIMHMVLPNASRANGASFVLDVVLTALIYPAAIFATIGPQGTQSGTVLKEALPRYGTSLATMILSYLWVTLWMLIPSFVGAIAFALVPSGSSSLIVPGAAAGIVALAVLPRPFLVALVMLPIAMVENVSPGSALGRARRRVGHAGFRRAWLLGIAIVLITFVPGVIATDGLEAVVKMTHVTALRILAALIGDVISLGLGIVLITVTSLELRARSEGADLEAQLESGVAPADAGG